MEMICRSAYQQNISGSKSGICDLFIALQGCGYTQSNIVSNQGYQLLILHYTSLMHNALVYTPGVCSHEKSYQDGIKIIHSMIYDTQ